MNAPKLNLARLREIVTDAGELTKGTQVADGGGLSHLARFELKLFADAAGSGASPYKVQIVFDDSGNVKGRCSCMAARSRPFCKHAAALLVSWARAPDSFAVAETAPAPAAGEAKKREVKKGSVDGKDLMARGVEQAGTLVRELASAGVRALAADRAEQVRALGEGLRDAKLRRVSARTLELAAHLRAAATRSESFDAAEYAEILGDMLLTVRKLEKHLEGEALAPEHVEELIGKTWTRKDRKPIAGLELVEYAFAARTTADGFLIRESRFLDLASGAHFSEKQIVPGFLVKRTDPKRSWAGRVLGAMDASVYPSYAPRRLDIEAAGHEAPLDETALARLLEAALPDVGAALTAFQERRKDVFAPEALPVALRAESLFADGGRMQALDAHGAALFLPEDPELEARLAGALMESTLLALFGDVVLDGALPTLVPLAALVRAEGRLQLLGLGGLDAAMLLASRKLRAEAVAAQHAPVTRWVDVARRVGASPAAIALGEVREEMAEALAQGLAAVTPRAAGAWVSRLSDLGLAKQAELLQSLAQRPDPEAKLDDFIKLHQVLGIALSRLAGVATVDRATLEAVPTAESVKVRRPERALPPEEVTAAVGTGRLSRYEAAWHRARHIEALGPEALEAAAATLWADGSATPFIARALARHPQAAVAAALRVLTPDRRVKAWRRPVARVASLTAIRVLQAAGTPEARAVLRDLTPGLLRRDRDAALAAHAQRALRVLDAVPEPADARKKMDRLVDAALNASSKEEREKALRQLAEGACVEAIPAMRLSFAGDVSADVRKEAAYALARVGDIDSAERFVRMLRDRAADPAQAKLAAQALGILGDLRGVHELLAAWAEGWHPAIVSEAVRQVGPAALEPLVSLLEATPALAERKAALGIVAALPAEDVAELLAARLEAIAATPAFVERAGLYLALAGAATDPAVAKRVAQRVIELAPQIQDKKASREEKALARRCEKQLAPTA